MDEALKRYHLRLNSMFDASIMTMSGSTPFHKVTEAAKKIKDKDFPTRHMYVVSVKERIVFQC